MFKFLEAFLLLEGGVHIELLALVFLAIDLIDSLLGATGSILNVVFVG